MTQIKVELQETMGSDKSIAECAWTSSLDLEKKKKRTNEQIERVINMLADQKHGVPFESVVFRFWIKVPIVTDRQIEKHRISSQNGLSARYRTVPNEYLETTDEIDNLLSKISNKNYDFFSLYYQACEQSNEYYSKLVQLAKESEKNNIISNSEFKRVREFYRGILPQHNLTEKTITINLRSFCNFIKLRLSPHAQPEIQEVARQMLEVVKNSKICPIALQALERNNWNV